MKRYVVKALSVGGRGNKIYKNGDVVIAENFPHGNADILIEEGFLEPIPDDVAAFPNLTTGPTAPDPGEEFPDHVQEPKAVEEAKAPEEPQKEEPKQVRTLEQFTTKELQDELNALGVPFSDKAGKKALYKIWADLQN